MDDQEFEQHEKLMLHCNVAAAISEKRALGWTTAKILNWIQSVSGFGSDAYRMARMQLGVAQPTVRGPGIIQPAMGPNEAPHTVQGDRKLPPPWTEP